MGLKVSDEFTLPLCNVHHDAVHRTGEERAWWGRHGIIEPLKFAARLWAASRNRTPGDEGVIAGSTDGVASAPSMAIKSDGNATSSISSDST